MIQTAAYAFIGVCLAALAALSASLPTALGLALLAGCAFCRGAYWWVQR